MRKLALTAISVALLTGGAIAQDQPSGIKRTPLQKIDFPDNYTTVSGLAEIQPGMSAGMHTHPGIETGYILEGETMMTIPGQPDKTLKAGDSYVIPAGVPHDPKAVGEKPVKVIAVYVVERGKPLASPVK